MDNNNDSRYALIFLIALVMGIFLGAYILSNINFALPGIFAKIGIVAPKSILDDFNNKFQDKLNKGSFPLVLGGTFGSPTESKILIGKIDKITSQNSFILKVNNDFKGGSITDFILNQPDFYDIQILADDKTVFTKIIIPKSPQEAQTAVANIGETIKISDLKEGEMATVVFADGVDLAKSQGAKAVSVSVVGVSAK